MVADRGRRLLAGGDGEESARRIRGLTLALFAVALAARVVVFAVGSDRPNNDELGYAELAVEIAAGRGFERRGVPESHISPLFPWLHALPVALGAEPVAAGRTLGILTSAAAAPLAAWAFWTLLGRRAAALAGLAIALHPRLLVTAERIQPEALAALCLLLFAALWARGRPGAAVLAAVLGYLTRPEGIVLVPLAWLASSARDRAAWRRLWAPTLVGVLLATPYLLHLRAATGGWTLLGKADWVYAMGVAQSRLRGGAVPLEALTATREEVRSPLSHLVASPGEAIGGYLDRSWRAAREVGRAAGWVVLALAGLGLYELWRRRRRLGPFALSLAPLAAVPLAAVAARHALPYVPIFAALAAFGAVALVDRGSGRRRGEGGRSRPNEENNAARAIK